MPPEAVPERIRLTVACVSVEHMLGRYRNANPRLPSALDVRNLFRKLEVSSRAEVARTVERALRSR